MIPDIYTVSIFEVYNIIRKRFYSLKPTNMLLVSINNRMVLENMIRLQLEDLSLGLMSKLMVISPPLRIWIKLALLCL